MPLSRPTFKLRTVKINSFHKTNSLKKLIIEISYFLYPEKIITPKWFVILDWYIKNVIKLLQSEKKISLSKSSHEALKRKTKKDGDYPLYRIRQRYLLSTRCRQTIQ